jgi:hypothetical protein
MAVVTRSRATALAVALLAIAVGVVLFLVMRDDDEGQSGSPATRALLDDPVSVEPARDEALALMRAGSERTVHARYEAVGATNPGFPRTMEVWRKDGRSRIDAEYAAADRIERAASFREGDQAIACRRSGDYPWTCERVPVAEGDMFEQAIADVSDTEITATDREVRGREARCFALAGEEPRELCFDGDGLLLRLAAADAALELVDADADVSDADFEPPAEPV